MKNSAPQGALFFCGAGLGSVSKLRFIATGCETAWRRPRRKKSSKARRGFFYDGVLASHFLAPFHDKHSFETEPRPRVCSFHAMRDDGTCLYMICGSYFFWFFSGRESNHAPAGRRWPTRPCAVVLNAWTMRRTERRVDIAANNPLPHLPAAFKVRCRQPYA